MEEDQNNNDKVIFLGDSSVGKTSLIKISTGQSFNPNCSSTLTASYVSKQFKYNNNTYIFNLWDTIGQEKYRALTKIFFKDAIIVILVYDITKKTSFDSLNYWYEQIENELNDNYILAIVGNKKDLYLEEIISEQEGKDFANSKNAKFKLSSAKDDPLSFSDFLEELFVDYINKSENKIKNKTRGYSITKKDYVKNKNKNNNKCC